MFIDDTTLYKIYYICEEMCSIWICIQLITQPR